MQFISIYFTFTEYKYSLLNSKTNDSNEFKSLKEIFQCLNQLQNKHFHYRCYWPLPISDYEVRCGKHLVYDLTVRPRLVSDYLTNDEFYRRRIKSMESEYNITFRNRGFSLVRQYWLLVKNATKNIDIEEIYDIYPQMIDVPEAVKNISLGLEVSQAPINDEPMYLISTPENVCASTTQEVVDILIVIKNIPIEFKRRRKIRKFYSTFVDKIKNFNFKVIFNCGLPYSETGSEIKLKYMNATLHGRAGWSVKQYMKESGPLTQKLLEEAKIEKDILIGNYYDNYYNLSRKMFTGIRWGSIFCRDKVKMFLFTDDDEIVNMTSVSKIYRSLSKSQLENLYAGNRKHPMPALRPQKFPTSNRWGMDEDEYPWRYYPPFLFGMAFFMGPKVAKKVAIGCIFVEKRRIDDTNIGIVLQKLSIIPKNVFGIMTKKYSDLDFETEFVGKL